MIPTATEHCRKIRTRYTTTHKNIPKIEMSDTLFFGSVTHFGCFWSSIDVLYDVLTTKSARTLCFAMPGLPQCSTVWRKSDVPYMFFSTVWLILHVFNWTLLFYTMFWQPTVRKRRVLRGLVCQNVRQYGEKAMFRIWFVRQYGSLCMFFIEHFRFTQCFDIQVFENIVFCEAWFARMFDSMVKKWCSSYVFFDSMAHSACF